jgi:hypothetical protein
MKAAFWFLAHVASILVVVIGLVIGWQYGWLDPAPYRDVELVEVRREGEGHLFVHVRYTKTEANCTYQQAIPYAILPGDRVALRKEVFRDPGVTEQRLPGVEHLRWRIELGDWPSDRIHIWTSHECNGRNVPRMMIAIEVPQ